MGLDALTWPRLFSSAGVFYLLSLLDFFIGFIGTTHTLPFGESVLQIIPAGLSLIGGWGHWIKLNQTVDNDEISILSCVWASSGVARGPKGTARWRRGGEREVEEGRCCVG